jgi:hypothetical protein
MRTIYNSCVATLVVCVAACEIVETSVAEQPGITMQGTTMQGITMQGIDLQGIDLQSMNLQGFRFAGATLGGVALANVRVERGELVAEQGGVTLRGAALAGAQLTAEARNTGASPPLATTVAYRIAAVAPELPQYDPTGTGATYLYTL